MDNSDADADAIRANIAQIATAVNHKDLALYGSAVTDDFVNMNQDLDGDVSSTITRQGRLDALSEFFAGPFDAKVTMHAAEVYADNGRGFAKVDGTLRLVPETPGGAGAFTVVLVIYLSFIKTEASGWCCERSMGFEKLRAMD